MGDDEKIASEQPGYAERDDSETSEPTGGGGLGEPAGGEASAPAGDTEPEDEEPPGEG
jgi:hypothetical protein